MNSMFNELLQVPRPLTLAERRWLGIHAMGVTELADEYEFSRTKSDPVEAGRRLNAIGVPSYTGDLDSYQRGVLATMPEPLRFMMFPDEDAIKFLTPVLWKATNELLQKIFQDPLFVAAYNAEGWLYVEELQQCAFINQHHRRLYARLYGLFAACFQHSIREDSVQYFKQCGYRPDRQLKRHPPLEGGWMTLTINNVKIAAQRVD